MAFDIRRPQQVCVGTVATTTYINGKNLSLHGLQKIPDTGYEIWNCDTRLSSAEMIVLAKTRITRKVAKIVFSDRNNTLKGVPTKTSEVIAS